MLHVRPVPPNVRCQRLLPALEARILLAALAIAEDSEVKAAAKSRAGESTPRVGLESLAPLTA